MTPLNLTVRPPRPARDEIDGLIFLPRSIDKARASLPGGELGVYCMPGLTQSLLDEFAIPLDAFILAVAAADNDAAVAAFVRERAPAGAYERWNSFITTREPRGGNRDEALAIFPWLIERPDLTLVLDVLAEDDKRLFASTR